MNIITLTKDNLEQEHICCAIADKKSRHGVASKKEWLACRMQEGLKFKKLDARGKVFIEYLPADQAWVPVQAPGYTFINCHWVSGSFKGQGYGTQLLQACEEDVKDSNGIVLIVGNKKKPFLSDKGFFLKHGFEVCDHAAPYFELLVKRFTPAAPLPSFKPSAHEGMGEGIKGIDIFYTAQCPFTATYIDLIKPVAAATDYPVRIHQLVTREQAQEHVCPITTYSVFIDGVYFSNEIMTPQKLEKLIAQQGQISEI